jgi:hypothetical protein
MKPSCKNCNSKKWVNTMTKHFNKNWYLCSKCGKEAKSENNILDETREELIERLDRNMAEEHDFMVWINESLDEANRVIDDQEISDQTKEEYATIKSVLEQVINYIKEGN